MDAYASVWNLLNSKYDFQLLFGTSPNPRQVRLDDPRYLKSNPDSDDLAKAAFPRVRVAITELKPMTERDSSSSQCTATFEIQVWSGVQQQRLVLDAAWVIYRAMLGWRLYARQQVFWQGSSCICDVDARSVTVEWPELEGRGEGSDKRDSKGYEQWLAVYQTVVQFYFKTTDLQTY
jgi:hypothetical protein